MSTAKVEELTYRDVLQLLDIVRTSVRFGSVDLQFGATRVHVESAHDRGSEEAPASGAAEEHQAAVTTIAAPTIGIFRLAGTHFAPGRTLAAGTCVGVIDTLGVQTPIRVGAACTIVEIAAPADSFVEYGQPLLRMA